MKLLRKLLFPLLILLLLCQPVLAADFSRLGILHTNDTHGYDGTVTVTTAWLLLPA